MNNIKWSDEQQSAIDKMIAFATNRDEHVLVLTGYAGVGKTAVMNEFVQFLDSKWISFVLCAPTHKAKSILSQATNGYPATTLHSLLGLSPELDIFHLDYSNLKFKSSGSGALPDHGIIILDEASMVSDELYDLLIDYCKQKKSKILFIGDIAQIRPVKNGGTSKVFDCTNIIKLTKVFRQDKENALSPLLLQLRNNPVLIFKDRQGESGSLIVHNSTKEFILSAVEDLKYSLKHKDTNNVKIIAYTNNRVKGINSTVRRCLFDDDEPYHIGEILTGCENFKYNRHQFYNSADYAITKIEKTNRKIPEFVTLPGYLLTVHDNVDNRLLTTFVIDTTIIDGDYLDSLAQTIENIRQDAILARNRGNRTASKYLWTRYYAIIESFASHIPLMFDNRVVKASSLAYGYAITAHKSQGSSYNKVYIDMNNLFLDKDLTELRQLQYVALSRTKTDAHILV